MIYRICIFGIAFLLTSCSGKQGILYESIQDPPFIYTCSDGSIIKVKYRHPEERQPSAEVEIDGVSTTLEKVRSASGSKYSNGLLVWWEKGGTGFVQLSGQIVKRECAKTE